LSARATKSLAGLAKKTAIRSESSSRATIRRRGPQRAAFACAGVQARDLSQVRCLRKKISPPHTAGPNRTILFEQIALAAFFLRAISHCQATKGLRAGALFTSWRFRAGRRALSYKGCTGADSSRALPRPRADRALQLMQNVHLHKKGRGPPRIGYQQDALFAGDKVQKNSRIDSGARAGADLGGLFYARKGT
jgi:hypothetical protein